MLIFNFQKINLICCIYLSSKKTILGVFQKNNKEIRNN